MNLRAHFLTILLFSTGLASASEENLLSCTCSITDEEFPSIKVEANVNGRDDISLSRFSTSGSFNLLSQSCYKKEPDGSFSFINKASFFEEKKHGPVFAMLIAARTLCADQ